VVLFLDLFLGLVIGFLKVGQIGEVFVKNFEIKMKNILISGGPVHAHLDAVKIITNRFKGGLMAATAEQLNALPDVEVHYLSSKGSVIPGIPTDQLHEHFGFHDYMKKVLEMAPKFDAVILGAAVCNLILINPFEGKFPSHNYKPGDIIPIDFTIAPRVIDEVKKVAPNTHLFGFKLLSGVPHEELIQAAYDIVLESKATCVFANDATDLNTKFAVTKEGAEHKMDYQDVPKFIMDMVNDKYYSTELVHNQGKYDIVLRSKEKKMRSLIDCYRNKFVEKNGYVFGTVAVRLDGPRWEKPVFLTTARGKNEIEDFTIVENVDHENRVVKSYGKKATLNAPLLERIFWLNPNVKAIVHYHDTTIMNFGTSDFKILPYAPPGTQRDSLRDERYLRSDFEIRNHGIFILIREQNNGL